MSLEELTREIHQNAVEHGWWEEDRSFGEIVALCHSELSEALEEYRAGRPMEWKKCLANEPEGKELLYCGHKGKAGCELHGEECSCRSEKPEGIAVEMADCIIRILDWCGREGVDIERIILEKHEYNKTRPYRHGGKVI